MHIRDEYVLKEYGSDAVVLSDKPAGRSEIIELNESGVVLWKALKNGDDPVRALTALYDVSEEAAADDVQRFVEKLRLAGIMED